MSNSRIKVVYIKHPAAVGETRWLDTATGTLYSHLVGGYPVSTDYKKRAEGGWINDLGSVVGAVALPDQSPEQAYKADDGKPNWFLLMSAKGCAKALAGVVRVLSFAVRPVAQGGKGYTPHSWREVPNAKERYEAALYRHLNKVQHGESHDDESGESHWYHVACNALFLAELHNAEEKQ